MKTTKEQRAMCKGITKEDLREIYRALNEKFAFCKAGEKFGERLLSRYKVAEILVRLAISYGFGSARKAALEEYRVTFLQHLNYESCGRRARSENPWLCTCVSGKIDLAQLVRLVREW